VREQRSAYLPTAWASLTGAEALKNTRIAAGGLNNPVIYPRYANGVTVDQLITDFGRTSNLVKSSKMAAQARQNDVDATRDQVLLRVAETYYNVLRAHALLKVAQESVKERQTVVDQVTALAASKLKSAIDISFAKVNLADAQLLLVKAQDQVQSSYADLAEAMGLPSPQPFDLVEQPVPQAPDPNLHHLVEVAMRQRPELRAMASTWQATQDYAKAERDLSLPTVSAVGSAGLVPWHVSQLPDHYAAVGVNVNIPIFNGFLFSARRTQADLQSQAANQQLLDLQHRVARDVRVAWLQTQTARQRLSLTAQLLQQATLTLDLAQARYKLGLGSIVELSQAQLNMTQAQLESAAARYDYQIDMAALHYQLGMQP